MSEYIEIQTEILDTPHTIRFHTNLPLTAEGQEQYHSIEAMEEGSPVAQLLSGIAGIVSCTLEQGDIVIRRDPETEWHNLVADVAAALKEFFL
ncbi:MAG: NifU N-terminal domain-containing protein [Chloroflexi bacterium]|nr:NifU N-terminal domain-containing protein [Chloroflexota bacterium]MBP8056157.1 NifU N-terminal domain-containing protein [Chloroflexota bacterium]